MKKTLGALSLLGASALVLSGCAGASTPAGGSAETGDLTVWLVGTDTPQDARDYLEKTFEEQNDGWTLTIEEKTWADTAEGYVAALSSNDAPDIVEVGNTQAPGFISQGLFADLSGIHHPSRLILAVRRSPHETRARADDEAGRARADGQAHQVAAGHSRRRVAAGRRRGCRRTRGSGGSGGLFVVAHAHSSTVTVSCDSGSARALMRSVS